MIVTLFVTKLPEGFEGYQYDQRGWTTFERSSAELIKPSKPYVVEEGKTIESGRYLWSLAIDSSFNDADEGRRPPLAPAGFAALLESRRFTNNADATVVTELYERTARSVLGSTT